MCKEDMARQPAFVDLNELASNRVRREHLRPFTFKQLSAFSVFTWPYLNTRRAGRYVC